MSTPLGNNTPLYKTPNTPMFLIRLSNHMSPLDSLYMPTHHPYCMYPWHRLPDTTTLHPPNHSNRHQHCCTFHYRHWIYTYLPHRLYTLNCLNTGLPHIHTNPNWMLWSWLLWCWHDTMYMPHAQYHRCNNTLFHMTNTRCCPHWFYRFRLRTLYTNWTTFHHTPPHRHIR